MIYCLHKLNIVRCLFRLKMYELRYSVDDKYKLIVIRFST